MAELVLPGVHHWSIFDERIDFVGDSYAFEGQEGTILVDPHPLDEDELAALAPVSAICLTSGSHQRAAWPLRRELGAKVYLPALSKQAQEEPDVRYGDGDLLPGGIEAFFTPGAGTTQHTFLLRRDPGLAVCPDLLLRNPDGSIGMVPDRYLHDPAEARRSLEKLVELPYEILLLTHGGPVTDDPKGAIRNVLAS